MKKDQVIILEKRGTVLIKGEEASDFLQNIITNDISSISEPTFSNIEDVTTSIMDSFNDNTNKRQQMKASQPDQPEHF